MLYFLLEYAKNNKNFVFFNFSVYSIFKNETQTLTDKIEIKIDQKKFVPTAIKRINPIVLQHQIHENSKRIKL
jgi:hypothetical protein